MGNLKRFKTIQFLWCFLILKKYLFICSDGCSICSNNTCYLCDFQNGFYLNSQNNLCSQQTIQNCQNINIDLTCKTCAQNFYPDSNSTSCLSVANTFSNCLYYNQDQSCSQCEPGFYLSNTNSCAQIQNQIMNCYLYGNSDFACNQCEPGFLLVANQTQCVSLNQQKNCAIVNQIFCETCQDNFYVDKNAYIYYLVQQIKSSNLSTQELNLWALKLQELILSLNNQQYYSIPVPQCMRSDIPNCLKNDLYGNCIECQQGYQQLNGSCQLKLGLLYERCKVYSTSVSRTCIQCNDGFYNSLNGCQPRKTIDNCVKYDDQDQENSCSQCSSNYFLQTKQICQPRITSLAIQNCLILDLNSDSCIQCNNGYSLIQQGQMCVSTITNCLVMSDTITPTTQCQQCVNGYYLNLSTLNCTQGTVTNCQQYQINLNKCQVCNSGYLLNPQTGNCDAHQFYSNIHCSVSSNLLLNFCEKCQDGFVRARNHNYCQYVNNSDVNCQQVDQNGNCTLCNDGFFVQGNTCTQITIANCLQVNPQNTNQCTLCAFYTQSINLRYQLSQDQTKCQYPIPNRYSNTLKVSQTDTYFGSLVTPWCYRPYFENFFAAQCIPTNDSMFSSYSSQLTNCKVFSFIDNKCIECDSSSSSPYVSSQGICAASCQSGEALHLNEIVSYENQDIIFSYRKNYCKTPANDQPFDNNSQVNYLVNNCQKYSYGLGRISQGKYNEKYIGCVQCQNGYQPLLNFQTPSAYGLTQQQNNMATSFHTNASLSEEGSRFSFVDQCVQDSTIISNYYTPISNPPTITSVSQLNCKFFISFVSNSTTKYSCYTCNQGYTGIPFYISSVHILDQCTQIQNCNSSITLRNLKPSAFGIQQNPQLFYPLDQLISCYQCATGFSLVFSASAGNTSTFSNNTAIRGGLAQKSVFSTSATTLRNTSTTYSSSQLGKQNECVSQSTLQQLGMIDNCALILNTPEFSLQNMYTNNTQTMGRNTSNKMTVTEQGIRCVACLPGFRPLFDQNNLIGQCVPISNCIDSNISNQIQAYSQCTTCNINFIFGFNKILNIVDKSVCVQNYAIVQNFFKILNENCYAGIAAQNTVICYQCKNDYLLDDNNNCVKKQISNCQTNQTNNQVIKFNPNTNGKIDPYDNLLNQTWNGCSLCSQNYIATIFDDSNKNQQQQVRTSVPKYGDSDQQLCSSALWLDCCEQNTIWDYDTLDCLQANSLYLLDDNKQCQALSAVAQDNATGVVIANCQNQQVQILKQDKFNSTFKYQKKQICLQCSNGYYLYQNACYQGKIANCNVYESPLKCLTCQSGYIPISNSYNSNVCLQQNSNDKCLVYDPYYLSIGELKCIQCQPPTQQTQKPYITSIEGTYPQYNCLQVPVLQNCASYLNGDDIMFSMIGCKKCINGYYVVNQKCQQSTVIQNCQTYNSYKDSCISCSNGYLLLQENICYQDQIQDINMYPCVNFISLNQCAKCADGFYLSSIDSKCYAISYQDLISNCVSYSSLKTCTQCASGYYLLGEICQKGTINNCSIYLNEKQCQKCNLNYGIQIISETENTCVLMQIDNCESYDLNSVYPFRCSKCSYLYYVNQYFQCEQLVSAVTNCKTYKDNRICAECEEGYFYTSYNNSCQSLSLISQLVDQKCSWIKLEINENCLVCQKGFFLSENGQCMECINGQQQGCMFCDPKQNNVCLLCEKNYHMDSSGNCIQYKDSNYIQQQSSTKAFGFIIALLYLLFV